VKVKKASYCERHGCDHQPVAYDVVYRLPCIIACLHCGRGWRHSYAADGQVISTPLDAPVSERAS
jgi:hypothetical protein